MPHSPSRYNATFKIGEQVRIKTGLPLPVEVINSVTNQTILLNKNQLYTIREVKVNRIMNNFGISLYTESLTFQEVYNMQEIGSEFFMKTDYTKGSGIILGIDNLYYLRNDKSLLTDIHGRIVTSTNLTEMISKVNGLISATRISYDFKRYYELEDENLDVLLNNIAFYNFTL